MHIEREFDKVFRVTITEKEAVLICDSSIMDFERTRHVATILGVALLEYMKDSCQAVFQIKPSMEVEF